MDYRGLNDVTKKIHILYPIYRIFQSRTTLDCALGYSTIPVVESDKAKTAFSVPRGKFEFNVMNYGSCNSRASFQRLMDMTLSELAIERILAYVDDICLFSATFSEHMGQLTYF